MSLIAAALVKIGKNDLDGAVNRLEGAVRMIQGLQKQKSQNREHVNNPSG